MLNQYRRQVSLSLMSFDLPVWSVTRTAATLYPKDDNQFHILLTEPIVQERALSKAAAPVKTLPRSPRLLWLELSAYRLIMTMQGNGRFSYRHFWEPGVYGKNRYWLQSRSEGSGQLELRNFTRSLDVSGEDVPERMRLEYELWSYNLCLGHYVMNLDVHPE
ncbi:MAG: hypothetical protein AAF289_16305 [Cyanobacteria bacterium P01_A01_bin.135]